MDKAIDVILEITREQWSEIHHVESQRAGLTNILLILESGAVALIVQGNYSLGTLPICGLLLVCGTLGLMATKKYYERFKFAQMRLTEMYRAIDQACPNARLMDTLRTANVKHNPQGDIEILGYHLKKLRLYTIWALLHSVFLVTSLILGSIVLIKFFA